MLVGVKRIYIETSVISYAVARPSRDPILAGQQLLTRRWLSTATDRVRFLISDAVIDEIALGDLQVAKLRLSLVEGWEVVSPDRRFLDIAASLAAALKLPKRGIADATHIASAVAGGADFLATWSCRYIANPNHLQVVRGIVQSYGAKAPEICTPVLLFGEEH